MQNSQNPRPKTKMVVVKMTPEEYATIFGKSQKWTGGNVSALMRAAGKGWVPLPTELVNNKIVEEVPK
jgi:hypothetical protein